MVTVSGLLWISLCGLVGQDSVFFFFVSFFGSTRPADSIMPPCLIYLFNSTTPRGGFVKRGYLILCKIYKCINPGNRLTCRCLLHSRPSWGVRTATCYGSNAAVQLLYAAAANSCNTINTYAIHATGLAAGTRLAPPPYASTAPASSAQLNP